jgi:hypothetical protein
VDHEGGQLVSVGGRQFGDRLLDGGLEIGERGVIAAADRAALDELLQPLDQVEIWRVRWQKQPRDADPRPASVCTVALRW